MAEKDKNTGSSLINRNIGGYHIRKLLGKGGMGEVYEGYEESLDRKVAVKVLRPALAADEEYTARFLREARAAAHLEYPGICPMYAAGEQDGVYYFAMQYVAGRTIRQYLKESGSFPVQQALLVIQHAAAALGYAHSKGFIHRDIKPDNIMVDDEGRIRVMDFGLARSSGKKDAITQTGDYLGTPEYSSPEQCMTSIIDSRSDLYSLGVVLYEMLTGSVPHSAETPLALFRKICDDPLPPIRELNPGLPEGAAAVTEKLLAKDPNDRYADADELIEDVDRILKELDDNLDPDAETMALPLKKLASSTPAVLKPTPVTAGRHRTPGGLIAAVTALILITAVMAAVFLGSRNDTATETRPAGSIPEHAVLLVCDFTNSNRNPDIQWMSIAVADMSITDLSQCQFLKVISREELNTFLQNNGISREEMMSSLTAFSNRIKADMILKGSVAKLGEDIRIDIQLLDGSDGSIILSAGLTEPEQTFFKAIDTLSISMRTRIAQYLQARYPGMQTASRGEDLSVERQFFTGTMKPELVAKADLAREEVLSDSSEEKGNMLSAQPPAPEKTGADLMDGAAAIPAEKKTVLKKREETAPPAALKGAGKASEEKSPVLQRGKAEIRKAAAAAPEAKADKAPRARFGAEVKGQSPEFQAIRCYYKACTLLESDPAHGREDALRELERALILNPAFTKARNLRDELTDQ